MEAEYIRTLKCVLWIRSVIFELFNLKKQITYLCRQFIEQDNNRKG